MYFKQRFPKRLCRADLVTHTFDRHAKKTMLLTEVVPGNVIGLNRSEIPTKKPAGFDSVITTNL
jgi:hypothetical protein